MERTPGVLLNGSVLEALQARSVDLADGEILGQQLKNEENRLPV